MEALMTALAPTDLGKWLNERHIQVYGWVNAGANLSTANGAKDGNYPAAGKSRLVPRRSRFFADGVGCPLSGDEWQTAADRLILARPHLPVRSRGASWTGSGCALAISSPAAAMALVLDDPRISRSTVGAAIPGEQGQQNY